MISINDMIHCLTANDVGAAWVGAADYPYLMSLVAAFAAYALLSPFGTRRAAGTVPA